MRQAPTAQSTRRSTLRRCALPYSAASQPSMRARAGASRRSWRGGRREAVLCLLYTSPSPRD
eukprot:11501687-Alexandrium_andersonii.AAC.1